VRGVDGEDEGGPVDGRPGEGARRIAGEVFDARVRARAILEEAQAGARRILEGAEAERDSWRSAAEAAGREEGLARAAAELARGARERDRLLAACRGEVLDVAAAIAGRILGREVRPGADAAFAAGIALAELRGARRVDLRVSTEDLPGVRCAAGALGEAIGRLRVVEDASLATGEVVLEGEGARMDGRFPARIALLRRALEESEA
jgi:flagellar biosynthesis/type III secretory pathway protein FliH